MADTIRAGDRFGALTVIDIDNRPHRTSSWLCRCDCGQEAYFYTSRLLNGSAKSCGCKNHTDRNQQTDLTGKRFGHLLVIAAVTTRAASPNGSAAVTAAIRWKSMPPA